MAESNESVQVRIAGDKEAIIEQMLAGMSFAGACREEGVPIGTAYRWRQTDPVFDKSCRNLIEGQARTQFEREVSPEDINWKTRFAEKLRLTQSRSEALNEAKVTFKELAAALNPEHPEYDSEFTREVNEIMEMRRWMVEDERFRLARSGKSTMVRDYLDPPEEQQGGQLGSVQVNVFGSDGLDHVGKFLSERFASQSTEDFGRLRGAPRRLEGADEAGTDGDGQVVRYQ